MTSQERIPIIVGAFIAIALQLLLAPVISIGFAVPNFLLVYVIAVALVKHRSPGYMMPFLLGLVFDLTGTGPVGGMALIFVLITFLISMAFNALDNETIFIPILLIVVATLFAEICYGLLMIACGMDVGLLDVLVYRCLPCMLYDTVLSLLVYPLLLRFVYRAQSKGEMPIIK